MRITAEELVVRRGATRAVDGVCLDIEAGRWLGVVGANGSGKTSLLRALAGRLEIEGGTILVDGKDRTRDRGWRARAIGFAPDPSSLPQSLTGAELFALLSPRGEARHASEALQRLRHALDFDRFVHRRIGSLSTGMRQRIAIFCAFLEGASTVFLDEPFNWLDPVCAFDTKEALRALTAEGSITLVTALHEMATLVIYCDAGMLLSGGRVSRLLSAADLKRGAADYAAFEAEMIRGLRSTR